jgi:hypothetical protein
MGMEDLWQIVMPVSVYCQSGDQQCRARAHFCCYNWQPLQNGTYKEGGEAGRMDATRPLYTKHNVIGCIKADKKEEVQGPSRQCHRGTKDWNKRDHMARGGTVEQEHGPHLL